MGESRFFGLCSNVNVLILYDVGFSIEKVCETFPFGREFVAVSTFGTCTNLNEMSFHHVQTCVETPLDVGEHTSWTGCWWAHHLLGWQVFHEREATWATASVWSFHQMIKADYILTRGRVALFVAFGKQINRFYLSEKSNMAQFPMRRFVISSYKSIRGDYAMYFLLCLLCFFSELRNVIGSALCEVARQFEWNVGCQVQSSGKKWLGFNPIGSMGLVYLPTYIYHKNQPFM